MNQLFSIKVVKKQKGPVLEYRKVCYHLIKNILLSCLFVVIVCLIHLFEIIDSMCSRRILQATLTIFLKFCLGSM